MAALQSVAASVSRSVSAGEGSTDITPGGSLEPGGRSSSLGTTAAWAASSASAGAADGGGGREVEMGEGGGATPQRGLSSGGGGVVSPSDAMQRAVLMRHLSSITRPTDSEVRGGRGRWGLLEQP